MDKKINKFLYWTPRILSIFFLLFVSIFSLDVFEGDNDFWGTFLTLLIHNIPVFVLALVLIVSWKYEVVGGVAFILAGIIHMIFSVVRVGAEPWYISFFVSLIIDAPAFLIGILFLIGWFKKNNNAGRLNSKILLWNVALNFSPSGNITKYMRFKKLAI